ncbi:RNA methyltransferase [Xylophilus rhododendri]|uniref:RNA methyltransferase n=1 Tax=Xylophilus rhododendri TaxID=2697032 RepID=A0A857IZD8_9BURK|nr:RNA methyltransferase [Xylophilus rhododendri]QHI96970.1 RNA methyltransferase [Xylophilus rhododendri]
MNEEALFIASRDNPLVRELRKLAQDNHAYRKLGRVWLEGDHLCRAALLRGWRPATAVFGESAWPRWRGEFGGAAVRNVIVADKLLGEISSLESPSPMGFLVELPASGTVDPQGAAVVLDRVQDAGNVGSILRSAAAFGFAQVLAIKGTAALWSPKVLRAGMGAHFGLQLLEGLALEDIARLRVPVLATSSHGGELLHRAPMPWPCAWLLGHEGQGVSAELEALASQRIRIAQPGGEESLNVAAAAAICLHASGAAR